ncbi:hypothetical protein CLV40_14518 [Actinokineospora auranticolor]|uniref:Uncharacterized protein n=1 Tax=Actinokineospora auranticolor TaxID=155976 RepID=A0A2S6GB92_9PSEU|nr:hypothetical protein CLV40_14518 [Actinokineospora auranticolor]
MGLRPPAACAPTCMTWEPAWSGRNLASSRRPSTPAATGPRMKMSPYIATRARTAPRTIVATPMASTHINVR